MAIQGGFRTSLAGRDVVANLRISHLQPQVLATVAVIYRGKVKCPVLTSGDAGVIHLTVLSPTVRSADLDQERGSSSDRSSPRTQCPRASKKGENRATPKSS
jgi:hypothetical protein